MRGVARALPADTDESARLLPAFVEYRLLALSAFAYYVSIWADKIVVYVVKGADAAAFYAAIAAVAWFSVIPAFAWIYVQVETAFYQRFRSLLRRAGGGRAAARAQAAGRADLRRGQAHPARRGRGADRPPPSLVIAAAPRIVARRRVVAGRERRYFGWRAGRGRCRSSRCWRCCCSPTSTCAATRW